MFLRFINTTVVVFSVTLTPALADDIASGLEKVPTQKQVDEYKKIDRGFYEKDEKITQEANGLSEKIDEAAHLPGVQLTRGHIDAAVVIHKKMRMLYLDYLNQLRDWAKKSNRAPCLHQAEKTQAYTIKVSDAWLARVHGLSLATQMDRISAFGIVQSGGGETFYPEKSNPVKYMVGREIEGLNAVCMGSQGEYEPGPK